MARPRFSEMLVDRRRQLGLSIAQISTVLRLKEQVLIAFEEGDFNNMPKSGYAQGMLSSYARHLGLNSRAVVRQFTNDLYEWEHRDSAREQERPRTAVARNQTASNMADYRGSRGLLPTSGGYAGDLGEFATTTVRSRQQSSPLVSRYRPAALPEGERRYTSREVPTQDERPLGARTQRQSHRQPGAVRRSAPSDLSYRDRVTTRRVAPGEYVDDLRYDDARSYEAASTRSGRASSRNIAQVGRPNVQRRRPSGGRGSAPNRNRSRQPQHSGILGVLEAYFSSTRRTMATIAVVVTIILTVLIISSVSSCVRGQETPAKTVAVSATTSTEASSVADSSSTSTTTDQTTEGTEDTTKDDNSDESSSITADATDENASAAVEATVVRVEIDEGSTTWIDIENDGTSEVAKTVTGPWSQEYTVTKSIVINAGNPSVVTVTKNGKQQSFDSKTSGLGTLTIEGTVPKDSSDADSDTASDGTDSTTASSTSSTSSSIAGASSTTSSQN